MVVFNILSLLYIILKARCASSFKSVVPHIYLSGNLLLLFLSFHTSIRNMVPYHVAPTFIFKVITS